MASVFCRGSSIVPRAFNAPGCVKELTPSEPMARSGCLFISFFVIELASGIVQEIEIEGFEGDGKDIRVRLTESRDGRILHQESTKTEAR